MKNLVHRSRNLKCQTDQSEAREPNGVKIETNQKPGKRKTRGIAGLVGRAMVIGCLVVLSSCVIGEGSSVDLTFFHLPHATRTATSSGATTTRGSLFIYQDNWDFFF